MQLHPQHGSSDKRTVEPSDRAHRVLRRCQQGLACKVLLGSWRVPILPITRAGPRASGPRTGVFCQHHKNKYNRLAVCLHLRRRAAVSDVRGLLTEALLSELAGLGYSTVSSSNAATLCGPT
jgi:hypothetical protein